MTEDLHKNRASSRQVYFADTSITLRKYTPATYFSNFQKGLGNLKFDHLYQFNQYPMQEFFGQFDLLKEEIERYRKSNYTVIVQATSHHNLQQLHKNLEEYGIRLDYIDGDTIIPQASQLVVGGLAHGFQFVDEKIVYITESEIYQKKIKRKIRRQNISNAERLKIIMNWKKGTMLFTKFMVLVNIWELKRLKFRVSIVIMFQFNIKMEIASRFLSIRFRCCPNTLQVMEKRQKLTS